MTVTEKEFIENCKISHGSVEHALELMEAAEVQNKAAVEQAFPGGWQSANIQVGRKPRPGEETMVSDVRDGLMVRCWGGDMASYRYYCFDFLDCNGKYIRTPDDVKIYSVATAFCPGIEIRSIEQSLANSSFQLQQQLSNPPEYARTYDPHWETYLVPEGTLLRITQINRPDVFFQIPMHAPRQTMLVPRTVIA